MVMQDKDKICYSIIEAASALSIGRSTLFKLLQSGEIKSFKFGARTLITQAELERFVSSLPVANFSAEKSSEAVA